VVAEGAKPKGGEVVISKIVEDSPDAIRLGGIAQKLAGDLEKVLKNNEIRYTVLGHIQRGGNTSSYDRILSTQYGVEAVNLINQGKFGNMVCLNGTDISHISLEKVIGKTKDVDVNGQLIKAARSIGISFGD
jgi:6-phosphofructokinase 1